MAQMIQPTPDEIVPDELAAEQFAHAVEVAPRVAELRDEVIELRRAVDLLGELLGTPAQLSMVPLTKAQPRRMLDERGIRTASIGVLNPNAVTVFLGVGGVPPTSQGRAIAVPPESLIVLPVAAGDVEIGTEADLSAGDAVVHVFRYRTVQPAFLGVSP